MEEQNLDSFFEITNKTLDEMTDTMGSLGNGVKALLPRLETSNSQFKKGIEQRDAELESDFNNIAKQLKVFSDNNEDFWSKTKEQLFYFNRKEMAQTCALQIKIFNNKARLLTHRMDELQKDFRYITPLVKASDLKLDIFIFDDCLYNFEKIISKILYISRDLTRLVNKERY
ncbi:hypothetical protein Dip510_000240 [Elusimicrobium posterum]|uniref:hypothetical protein n=1 Tax=Elusimicrobium posterum TaxID=3116653 RepID=UPI003C742524